MTLAIWRQNGQSRQEDGGEEVVGDLFWKRQKQVHKDYQKDFQGALQGHDLRHQIRRTPPSAVPRWSQVLLSSRHQHAWPREKSRSALGSRPFPAYPLSSPAIGPRAWEVGSLGRPAALLASW